MTRFLIGLSFEYGCIRERFHGKKLVRKTLIAVASARLSELRSASVASALLAKHTRKGMIRYRYLAPGHVSSQCPQCKHKKGNGSDTSSVVSDGSASSDGSSTSSDHSKGGRRQPLGEVNANPAVSRVAVYVIHLVRKRKSSLIHFLLALTWLVFRWGGPLVLQWL